MCFEVSCEEIEFVMQKFVCTPSGEHKRAVHLSVCDEANVKEVVAQLVMESSPRCCN